MENNIIVDLVSEKQPEKIAELNKMFNAFVMKSSMLQSYFKLKQNDRDKVVIEIMEFISTMQTMFIENWCIVEHSTEVINHLEEEITKMGGNLEAIRNNFNSK